MEFLRGLNPTEFAAAAIILAPIAFLLACMLYVQGKGYIVFGVLLVFVIILVLSVARG